VPDDEFGAREKAQMDLAMAYHNSVRTEIAYRLRQRDSGLFLYLAAASTVITFGLTANSGRSPDARLSLCLVPLLGLGAAHVYSQHNDVIGAMGAYLRTELDEYTSQVLAPASAPTQWDSSTALASLRSHRVSALWSSVTLVILPQLAALSAAAAALPPEPASVLGIVVATLACAYSAAILVRSYRRRAAHAQRLVQLLRVRTSLFDAEGGVGYDGCRPSAGSEPLASEVEDLAS